ncbi:MAG: conjugal transfer protein, partial [Actinobacteria bacterium]|nr:conjugal transfer protein [Actinomycetota bacterium]
MDLPTYTSIWRIEKRLYKLYDFRLPMPLPVGQIAVFAGITVPYVVVLTVLGLPFNHTLFWLYVLPPGVLTWLATRPVLESKRLPELIMSQVRYLGEPRTWCRMAPLAEKDDIVVVARVWRRGEARRAGQVPAARPQPALAAQAAEQARWPLAGPARQAMAGPARQAVADQARQALTGPDRRGRAGQQPRPVPGTVRPPARVQQPPPGAGRVREAAGAQKPAVVGPVQAPPPGPNPAAIADTAHTAATGATEAAAAEAIA